MTGSVNAETFSIKAEPEALEGGGIPFTKININLQNIKRECLEHYDSTTETAGKID